MHEKNKKIFFRPLLLVSGPAGYLLMKGASNFPETAERFYGGFVYPFISYIQHLVFGLLPFPVAELSLYAIAAWLIYKTAAAVRAIRARKRETGNFFLSLFSKAAHTLSLLYLLFVLLWGLNYSRPQFRVQANTESEKHSGAGLSLLCSSLISKTNSLCGAASGIPADAPLHMMIRPGFEEISVRFPRLAWRNSPPRKLLLPGLFSRLGISGIYSPLTGEANINGGIPRARQPFVASHEKAHSLGFARENEANFIAFLACRAHGDKYFRYSAYLEAMRYSMRALHRDDSAEFKKLYAGINPCVLKDIEEIKQYSEKYSGLLRDLSHVLNDAYLKSNFQKEGTRSYGLMVDLLLEEMHLNSGKI